MTPKDSTATAAAAAIPHWVDDPIRLDALKRYAVLDTPAEPAFDDIASLARTVTSAPIALVSFVVDTRQWFKAADGFGLPETPINTSICAYTIGGDDIFEVPDTHADARFAKMAVVTDYGARFYAGAPLRTADGHALGALCVLDDRPRRLTTPQREDLRRLARQVMVQLEYRRLLATGGRGQA